MFCFSLIGIINLFPVLADTTVSSGNISTTADS